MQATSLQRFPLSIQQAHLWSLQNNSQVYRTVGAIQIQGAWSRVNFEKALNHVVEQHEILRTAFYALPGMDIPMQVISDHRPEVYAEINLEHLTASEQQTRVNELFVSLKEERYNQRHEPPWLIRLVYLAADHQLILISLSALCADSYSLKLFIDELLHAYVDPQSHRDIIQYVDVSAWQEEQLLDDEATHLREYWRKLDLSQITSMKLPFQQKAQNSKVRANGAFAPLVAEIEIPDMLGQRVEMQAREYNVSVSAWLLACWEILLWRLGYEKTFVVGVACDGRNYEELADALGPYTRFVPIEARFERDRPFAATLLAVNTSLQEAIKRQLYFRWDQSSSEGTSQGARYFPVSFSFEQWPASWQEGNITCSLLQCWSCKEPFAVQLQALQRGQQLHLQLGYDPIWFSQQCVQRLARLFSLLLEEVSSKPQISIGQLALLDAQEREHLFRQGSGPQRQWPEQDLCQLVEQQARRQPGALAARSLQEELSYQQLNARANQLAAVLRSRGVGSNVVVGLCLPREASMLVALLGVLKAGGAYLPLDGNSPAARLAYQLQESQARLLLTREVLRASLPAWSGPTISLEELTQELAQASTDNPPSVAEAADLAYVMYTSGSTGMPKGVLISRGSMMNYTYALCERLAVQPGWQYATVSTLAADLGNTVLFCALASGGSVQVLSYEQVTSGQAMAQWARQHPIDVLKIVPSHLAALLEGEQVGAFVPRQALVLGGEALPSQLIGRLAALGVGCAVYNHYGPTETTIGVLVQALGVPHERQQQEGGTIALGRPIANTRVYVLDERMQLVPPGVCGELYIGGAGLAWGYSGQGGQTAERFVPDPFSAEPGARLYRTGDLVRWSEEGQLSFEGRGDGQVKLRGYRIEVGEIEAVLRQHPQVRGCLVLLQQEEGREPRLVGYVVSRQRQRIAAELLERWARERLPEYMVPQRYVQLEEWPLTANGKVDRQRLSTLQAEYQPGKRAVVAARTPIEELILQVWRELLAEEELGVEDQFFEVGGHSLLATRVMARLQQVFEQTLPVQWLFEHPTVAGLADKIEETIRSGAGLPWQQLQRYERGEGEGMPLSFAQQRLWFLEQLEPGSTAYVGTQVQILSGALQVQALKESLQGLMRRHESLRTSFEEQDGQPVQRIAEAGQVPLMLIDLQGLALQRRSEEARVLQDQEERQPFDLRRSPLWRCRLVRLAPGKHQLLLTLHHIITDGWSSQLLMRELTVFYQAALVGEPAPLAPLPVQYADYALWQRQWLQGEVLERQVAYWRQQLAGVVALDLPTDYPRPAVQSSQGASCRRVLSVELLNDLQRCSRQEGVTFFMLLLASFQVLLARWSGQKEISVGTPIANRTRAEIEGVVGFFVNTLVLRSDLAGNPSFRQVLQRVREVCLEAYAHQDVPFEQVVEAMQPQRDLSRSPLFQVMLILQEAEEEVTGLEGVQIRSLPQESQSSKFDLTLSLQQVEQGLYCHLEYCSDLFAPETMERLLEHWEQLLTGIVRTPQAHLSELPLLTQSERDHLLTIWNASHIIRHQDVCVHQLFEQQVRRTPEAIAMVCEEEQLSYAVLNQRANQLAHVLQKRGVGPDVLVGVCLERSLAMVIALLAVLKAGGAYVPLDPSYPKERLAFISTDAQVALILTQQSIALDQPLADGIPLLYVDTQWKEIASEQPDNLSSEVTAAHLAYVIYTSGSTGRPKGVMVPHNRVISFLTAMDQPLEEAQGASPGVWLALTSISFDISVLELFWTLTRGLRVVLQTQELSSTTTEQRASLSRRPMQFSLFYFSSDEDQNGTYDRYRLLLEGARFADQHDFTAVWTPERHFHAFGGLYPNPSLTSAALSTITRRVQLRAGSVVLPLHQLVRIAEEWSVVDNLSHGRVGVSFASGWHSTDFVLAPQNYQDRGNVVRQGIELLRKVWRGEALELLSGVGTIETVSIHPRPIQKELPIWLTTSGNPASFQAAGELGTFLLTHLLSQTPEELAEKIQIYRRAWREAGHQGNGHVTLMVHTYVGADREQVRQKVHDPFCAYLASSLDLIRNLALSLGYADVTRISAEDLDALLEYAFERYFDTSGLFGTVEHCEEIVEQLKWAGVDEIGALIDFGVDADDVLASLPYLDVLRQSSNQSATQEPELDGSIAALCQRHGVTHLQCTPSLAQYLISDELSREAVSQLKHILVGGEALTQTLAEQLLDVVQGQVSNMYGPTETTIWSTTATIQREDLPAGVTIGRPLSNTQVYVLDPDLQLVPIGVLGELYIGGTGVVRGYWRHPELTSERFVPHPFAKDGGERLYRTGDLVRMLPDGRLAFVGRVDQQVKVRGHRIELGEIEAVLGGLPAIQECVVLAREDRPGDKRLIAYVVAQPGTPLNNEQDLRVALQAYLPSYMLPSAFVFLEALPLTPNGKVDRRALSDVPAVVEDKQGRYQEARTPIEEVLQGLWGDVLGRNQVGSQDDFFASGGHSLLATQLIGRVRKALGVEVPLRAVFEASTVAALARYIEAMLRDGEGVSMPPLIAGERPKKIPLSFAQRRLWFLEQLHPGSTTYLDSGLLRFRGPLNAMALERSIREIEMRHESLRTTFALEDDQPVQIIHPSGSYTQVVIDLEHLVLERREEEARLLAEQDAQQPCDLVKGPLFRSYLLRLAPQEHLLILTLHHIITDGWSSTLLEHEITVLYQAYLAEQPSPLAPLPIQYADYAIWQQQWLQSEALQKHIVYWQQQLEGAASLELPTDAARSAIQSKHGARYAFTLSPELSAALVSLSRHEGVTLFMVLLTAYQILLYRLSGQTDIVVGTDVANRTHVETEGLIGFFVNLLALRTNMQGAPSFRKLLQQVRAMVLSAYTHQELPFELVVEHVQVERKEFQTPLIQTLLVLQNTPKGKVELPGIQLEVADGGDTAARFDLALFLQEAAEGIQGSVVYRAELFKEQTIASWMHQFEVLLSSIVANPDTIIDILEIYTVEEKARQEKQKLEKGHLEARRIRTMKNKGFELG